MKGQIILITGGAGFIGTSLAERLCEENRVILFDVGFNRMPFQFSKKKQHPNIDLVIGDVLDAKSLQRQLQRANIVIHAAAVVGVNRVRENPRQTITVNFAGTLNALQATEGHKDIRRFIYFSTSEIFGSNSFRVKESANASVGPVSEARWSYSIAKLAGEHLVNAYHRDLGLPTVIIRPFNIFGPKRLGDHAVIRFVLNSLQGKNLDIHGDGSQIRSWCYIEDFCEAVIRTLKYEVAIGEDFNIGSAKNTLTIYALAQRIIQLTGSKSSIRFTNPEFADIDIRVPRLDKARHLLGYEPHYELDEALSLTINWCREHLASLGELYG